MPFEQFKHDHKIDIARFTIMQGNECSMAFFMLFRCCIDDDIPISDNVFISSKISNPSNLGIIIFF